MPFEGTVTSTRTLQVLLAATVPFEKAIVPEPAAAVKVGEPHPLAAAPLGLAITIPAGSESEKERPDKGSGYGLLIVKVSVDVPPAVIVDGEKLLVIPNWEGSTRLIVLAEKE